VNNYLHLQFANIEFFLKMIIRIQHKTQEFISDLSKGIDISIPLISGQPAPKCFFAPDFKVEPVKSGNFIGEITAGSPVNFRNIFINPHGNGTHTECCGHITDRPFTINECLSEFHHIGALVSVTPVVMPNGDKVITKEILTEVLNDKSDINALIIRTIPNHPDKKNTDYSGKNPPYFSDESIQYINDKNILHLITDLPSIDREEDGGKLSCHKIFWSWPELTGYKKTITELVYIDNLVADGLYLCNIQIASIESDASPSKIVLYELNKSP
jgi:kynurenine formamidase